MNQPVQQSEHQSIGATPPGIIDTIGNAFALLNRRPYLIWIPIALDLLLWSGFRVSVIDPLSGVVSWLASGPDAVASTVERVADAGAEADLIAVVSMLVPTLLTDFDRSAVPDLGVASSASTIAGGMGLLALLGVVIVAVFVSVVYLTMIGRLTMDMPAAGLAFGADCLRYGVRIIGLVGVIGLLLLFLFSPIVLIGAGLRFLGLDPAVVLILAAMTLLVWAGIYFFFAAHAIVLGVGGPLQAMRSSYLVVRRSLISVMGLLLILLLIRAGTPVALQVFAESRWSIPFAIVVNAYVMTGLIAATMLYYRDRRVDSLVSHPSSEIAGSSR